MILLLLGAGGHGRVVLDCLKRQGRSVTAAVDDGAGVDLDLEVWTESELSRLDPEKTTLANGVGSVAPGGRRRSLFDEWSAKGYAFATIVHPSAVLAEGVVLRDGAQVMAGVILQPGVQVGRNALVNTSASIDHDCVLGDHVHIAPGAVLSGGVRVANGAHVGTGAVIIQGISIGRDVLVGAGAVVVGDLPDGSRVRAGARTGQQRG